MSNVVFPVVLKTVGINLDLYTLQLENNVFSVVMCYFVTELKKEY